MGKTLHTYINASMDGDVSSLFSKAALSLLAHHFVNHQIVVRYPLLPVTCPGKNCVFPHNCELPLHLVMAWLLPLLGLVMLSCDDIACDIQALQSQGRYGLCYVHITPGHV